MFAQLLLLRSENAAACVYAGGSNELSGASVARWHPRLSPELQLLPDQRSPLHLPIPAHRTAWPASIHTAYKLGVRLHVEAHIHAEIKRNILWHTDVHALHFCRFNRINMIHNKSLAGLKKLELLMLHSNDLHHLPDAVFADLKSLQVNNSWTHWCNWNMCIFQISPPCFHLASRIHELPLMSLFSSQNLTGHLTCGSNLRGRVNSDITSQSTCCYSHPSGNADVFATVW